MPFILTGCIAFVVSVMLVPRVHDLAIRLGAVDRPDQPRRIHRGIMPRMGGLAVVAGVACGILGCLLAVKFRWWGLSSTMFGPDFSKTVFGELPLIALGCAVVVGLGMVDDMVGVSPRTKLLVQVVAATVVFFGGVRFRQTFLIGNFGPVVQYVLTVVWLLACSNAVNLIDGMDGLASGVCLIATVTLFILALGGNLFLAVVMIAFAGALFGFLIFNFHPAVIFLGDTGSLFLGFAIGAFALQHGQRASVMVALAVPILVLGLPIMDTTLAVLRRWGRHTGLVTADREHLHHRLLKWGFSQTQAVLLLYAICIALSSAALIVVSVNPAARFWLGTAAAVLLVVVWLVGGGEFASSRRRIREELRRGALGWRWIRAQRRMGLALARAGSLEEVFDLLCDTARQVGFDEVELTVQAGQVDFHRSIGSGKLDVDDHWQGVVELTDPEGNTLGKLTFRHAAERPAPGMHWVKGCRNLVQAAVLRLRDESSSGDQST